MFLGRFPGFVFFVRKILSSMSKINRCILPQFLKVENQILSSKIFNSNVYFISIFIQFVVFYLNEKQCFFSARNNKIYLNPL